MTPHWLADDKQRLAEALEAGRLGHAPMLHGPQGLGKLSLARWLGQRILCLEPGEIEPCGQCRSCSLLGSGTHPDHFEIDVPEDKRDIPVDLIRNLIDRLMLTATIGQRRVGLIVNADAMNRNSANALLKTLEEPPAGAWLILVSHQPSRLPATILSRCQQLAVHPPAREDALAWLNQACPESDEASRASALSLAAGSPLAAHDMLKGGGLDRGLTILDHLLSGQAYVDESLTIDWVAHAEDSWRWIARWIALIDAHQRGAFTAPLPGQRSLPSGLPSRTLAGLWQQALEGGKLARQGVVRQELLLRKWLLEWHASIGPGY